MRSTKRTLERIQRIAERVERRQSLQRVLDAIRTRRISVEEKIKLLERIENDCMAGVITPAEANKMTKTVKDGAPNDTKRKQRESGSFNPTGHGA